MALGLVLSPVLCYYKDGDIPVCSESRVSCSDEEEIGAILDKGTPPGFE